MTILRQRGAPQYQLDEDKRRGFSVAVANGQVRLALEYADFIIDTQQGEVDVLKAEVESLKSTVQDLVRATAEEPRRGPGRPPKQPEGMQGTPAT